MINQPCYGLSWNTEGKMKKYLLIGEKNADGIIVVLLDCSNVKMIELSKDASVPCLKVVGKNITLDTSDYEILCYFYEKNYFNYMDFYRYWDPTIVNMMEFPNRISALLWFKLEYGS